MPEDKQVEGFVFPRFFT